MTTPSTADSQAPGASPPPVVERGALGPGATHAVVEGEVAPRLPHERDESSDSGKAPPTEVVEKAADDIHRGHTDQPRGQETQERYTELTRQSSASAKPA